MDETGRNVHIFKEVLFFKLRTTKKQKSKPLIQLILCQLDAHRLAEGEGHKTDPRGCLCSMLLRFTCPLVSLLSVKHFVEVHLFSSLLAVWCDSWPSCSKACCLVRTSLRRCVCYCSTTSWPGLSRTLSRTATCGSRCRTGYAGRKAGWMTLWPPSTLRKLRRTSWTHTKLCTSPSRSSMKFQVCMWCACWSLFNAVLLFHFLFPNHCFCQDLMWRSKDALCVDDYTYIE